MCTIRYKTTGFSFDIFALWLPSMQGSKYTTEIETTQSHADTSNPFKQPHISTLIF